MITIGYNILFTINVLHNYYDDKLSKDVAIVPTESCKKALKNSQMIFRPTANGGVILARIIDKDDTLQVPITKLEKLKLTFYLKTTSAYFYNRTNLELNPTQVTYLFPNRRGYYFDSFNREETNIFKVTGFPKLNEEKKLKHLSKTAGKEVSADDEVIFIPSIFRVKFATPISTFNINIKGISDGSIDLTKTITEAQNFNEYEIELAKNLAPGLYKIGVNAETPQTVYISNQVFHDAPFGIIEIFHPSDEGKFDFLKTTGSKIQIKEDANYYIWFKNRKLKWKYVFPKDVPNNIDINFTGGSDRVGNTIISKNEFDITNNYTKLKLTGVVDEKSSLPNPDGTVIKKSKTDPTIYVAEVFV